AMWNHAPKMIASGATASPFTAGEMRSLLSYLWARQFLLDAGSPGAGRRVFESKRCAACHQDSSSGAPNLAGRSFTASTMVSVLWHHGPHMRDQMASRHIAWPHFDGSQMSDLIAYLNSRKP